MLAALNRENSLSIILKGQPAVSISQYKIPNDHLKIRNDEYTWCKKKWSQGKALMTGVTESYAIRKRSKNVMGKKTLLFLNPKECIGLESSYCAVASLVKRFYSLFVCSLRCWDQCVRTCTGQHSYTKN